MKIRKGNMNGSLIVGVPGDMAKHMGIGIGSYVTWSLNEAGRWELVKLDMKAPETTEVKPDED